MITTKQFSRATKAAILEQERAAAILSKSKRVRRRVKSHLTTMQKIEQGIKLSPRDITGLNESFRRYGHNLQQRVYSNGEGVLEMAIYRSLPCGCCVTGNGSGAFPLTVKQCNRHARLA